MSDAVKANRPRYNNIGVTQLVHYRMPLAAIVSILHRISGAFVFLLLPFALYLLEKSLTSEISFAYLRGFASGWFVKLVILALSWAYLYHFCAGLRHLVMDTHMAADKEGARHSAAAVLVVSLVLAALVALKLFGAF
ncbi:MAG: Succinate dehydrogenase cytochrome b-556 subunit [Herminiimonas sp.]|nr:Succinate dehydrogenase cytochrome b-556 subunit [Herminiimonas sp.]MDB5855154.1 Succinate dehydrogenase cytochrome b-556 subunit [Herminiimonas sp.]